MKLKLYEFLYFFNDGEQLVCTLNGKGGREHLPMTVRELSQKELYNEIADNLVTGAWSDKDIIYIAIKY